MANNLGQQFTETARFLREAIPSASRARLEEKKMLFDIGQQQERTALQREQLGLQREKWEAGAPMRELQAQQAEDQKKRIEQMKATPFHLPTSGITKNATIGQLALISENMEGLQTIFNSYSKTGTAQYDWNEGKILITDRETGELRPITEWEFAQEAPQIAMAFGTMTDGMEILQRYAQSEDPEVAEKARLKLMELSTPEARLKYFQKMLATKYDMLSKLSAKKGIPKEYLAMAEKGIGRTADQVVELKTFINKMTLKDRERVWKREDAYRDAKYDSLQAKENNLLKTRSDLMKDIMDLQAKISSGNYTVDEGTEMERPIHIPTEEMAFQRGEFKEGDRRHIALMLAQGKRDWDLAQIDRYGKMVADINEVQLVDIQRQRAVLGGVQVAALPRQPTPTGPPTFEVPEEEPVSTKYHTIEGRDVRKDIYRDGTYTITDMTSGQIVKERVAPTVPSTGKKALPEKTSTSPQTNVTIRDLLGLKTQYMGPERVKKVVANMEKNMKKGFSLDMKIDERVVREIKKAMKEAGIAVGFINDWLKSMWYSVDAATKHVLEKVGDIEIPGLKR